MASQPKGFTVTDIDGRKTFVEFTDEEMETYYPSLGRKMYSPISTAVTVLITIGVIIFLVAWLAL